MNGESFGAKHFTTCCLNLHVEEILILKTKHLECLSFVFNVIFFKFILSFYMSLLWKNYIRAS